MSFCREKVKDTFLVNVLVFFILALFVGVNYLLALDVIDLHYRDNLNYVNAYNDIYFTLDNKEFFSSYSKYQLNIGSSEPMLFLWFWISSSLGMSYSYSIAILNLFFVFSISLVASLIFKSQRSLFVFFIYSFFNYYLFIFFSELHRLKLAMSIAFFLIYFGSRYLAILVGVFSHFQVILLAPYLFSLSIRFFCFLLLSISVYFYFYSDSILFKINYYYNFAHVSFFKSACIFMFFCFFSVWLGKNKKSNNVLIGSSCVLVMSFLFGGDRLNFMIIESFVMLCICLVFNYAKDISKLKISLLSLVVTFLCCYNGYKVLVQYAEVVGNHDLFYSASSSSL